MATEAQIIANRRNAQKSTGPRTIEGKAAVSQNAVKHGLAAAHDVIRSESQADFDLYRDQMFAELDPASPMESMLAERIVNLSWRLKRTCSIQNQTIDALNAPKTSSPLTKLTKSFVFKGRFQPQQDSSESAPALALGRLAIEDFSNASVLDRLLMYERRIEHSLYKTILELQRLNLIKKLNPGSEMPFNYLTNNQLPVTSYQLPVTSYQLPVTSYQLPITIYMIMQNKANLLNAQMNISSVLTKYYGNERLCRRGENKPKQTRSEVEIPTGVLLGILKPGTKQRQLRRQISLIFQDPYGSLNPRMTIGNSIGEPLKTHIGITGSELTDRTATLLSKVGLAPEHMNRYPHEFSGGQRQRIGVARALALEPKLVICDEPVSALDVSIQSQILNLLKDLQEEFELTYLFIAHDLAVVKFVCDIVAVMYLGKIVERATAKELYRNPLHPYTRALFSAIPQVEFRTEPYMRDHRTAFVGEVPSALNPPAGCAFGPRCPLADNNCTKHIPKLEEKGDYEGHFIACWNR